MAPTTPEAAPTKKARKSKGAATSAATNTTPVLEKRTRKDLPKEIEAVEEKGERKKKRAKTSAAAESIAEVPKSDAGKETEKDVENKDAEVDVSEKKKKRRQRKKAVEGGGVVEGSQESEKPAQEVSATETKVVEASEAVEVDVEKKRKRKRKDEGRSQAGEEAKAVKSEKSVSAVAEGGDELQVKPKKRKVLRAEAAKEAERQKIAEASRHTSPPPETVQDDTALEEQPKKRKDRKGGKKAAREGEAVPEKVTPAPPKPKSPSPDPEQSHSDEDVALLAVDEDSDEEDVHLHGFSTDEDSSDDEFNVDDEDGIDVGKLPTIAKDDAAVKRKLEKAKRQPVCSYMNLFAFNCSHRIRPWIEVSCTLVGYLMVSTKTRCERTSHNSEMSPACVCRATKRFVHSPMRRLQISSSLVDWPVKALWFHRI